MKLNRISLSLLFLTVPLFAVDVAAQKVSTATQKAIVKQLVNDGELTNDCVREAGGASEIVSIKSIDLNSDGKPEYFVEGNSGCAFGANSPYGWVYDKSGSGYKMLLSAGPNQGISRKKTKTKGYYDLAVWGLGNASTNWKAQATIYKFNGTRYQ
jgi:hypothetical protein